MDFSDITYLNYGRGTEHPLGDASLSGKLVELKSTTGEPDRYDFTGSGFNGQIRGHVSIASDNPYQFEVESKALAVTPILQILHPSLAAVTGTADGRAQITGTVAELAPIDENKATESGERRIYPYNVDVKIDSSRGFTMKTQMDKRLHSQMPSKFGYSSKMMNGLLLRFF